MQKAGFTSADKIDRMSCGHGTIKIEDLDLPVSAREFYIGSGINELYPPQAAAIEAGLLSDRNLVAAIPTASGKTLLAEFAMLKSILNEGRMGKALYIVPLRALASEKFDRFRSFERIRKSNGRGISTGISTGDLDSRDEWLGNFDIIVATSEKVDSLLRNRTQWMEDITVVVADEIHLIDSPDRGPTLEIVLAKLMRINPRIKVIALSATIGNADEVAKWLNAELVVSDWRPTELKEGVFFGSAINFVKGQRTIKEKHRDSSISLVADTLLEGGQCLVFESSRKNSEGLASRIGASIAPLVPHEIKEKLAHIADDVRESSEVDTARKLAICIENGSAFHHAGLIAEQRKLIEGGFRDGIIKVIVATPTLAAGLNLPARRVIIKGYRRYDANFGLTPIPVLEYKQMAGRAGRPHLDPYGESVLIARTYDELEVLMQQYVLAEVENIWSKLGIENALRTHILSTIATGFARSMEELFEFMKATFYSCQQEAWSLKAVIEKIIDFLIDKKMIVKKNGLFPTMLGELISRLYIDPLSASMMIEGMEKIEKKKIPYTELTLLHLACMTPDLRKLYLRANDYEWLSDFVMEHHTEFINMPAKFKVDYEWFLSEVKTTCVILDWINEKKEDDIVKKFGIGEGDIRALSETSLWLVHSMAELASFQKRSCAKKVRELAERVEYGASPELLDLIQIRGIGRIRARKLFNAGFRDMGALRVADPKKIAKLIGQKITIKVLKQIGTDVASSESKKKKKNSDALGISVSFNTCLIVKEMRIIIELIGNYIRWI
jgi:helicase